MAGRAARLSIPGMTLTRLFSLVVVFDILGLLVANESFGDKLLNGTAINAPFPFVVVQGLAVLAATRYRAGAVVLALLCLVSVFSGTSDGSYAADLAAGERLIQLGIVAGTLLLGVTAIRAAIRGVAEGERDEGAARRAGETEISAVG
jgi:uncharacterized membrane protein YphA (DoxX/SURF4 family)